MRDPRRQHTEKWKYLSKGINQYLHSRDASGFLYLLSNLTNPSNLILLKEVGAASISICWRELFTKWKKNCCRGTIDEDTLAAATGFAQSGWPCRSGLDRDKTNECISWARFPTPLHESTRSHLLGSVAFSSPLLIYDKHKVLSFPQRLLWGFLLTWHLIFTTWRVESRDNYKNMGFGPLVF